MRILAAIAVLVLVLACARIEPAPYEPPQGVQDDPAPVRPDIPRTYVPEEQPPAPQPEQPTGGQNVILEEDIIPHLSLQVPLGEPIGEHHPLITREEFPLLRHKVISLGPGSYVDYDEELRFDFDKNSTGRIVFAKDRDTDAIGTYLLFEKDKPIFEYRIRLRGATFEQVQGRNIQVLGHTYVIAEATNRSVTLFGVDVPSNVHFGDGSDLVVDSKAQSHTDVRVTPDTAAYRLYTRGAHDDGRTILLGPGESLSENVGQERLASLLFNIRYEGTGDIPSARIRLDLDRDGYELSYDAHDGPRTVPLAWQDGSRLSLGEPGHRLHVRSCPPSIEYCIAPGDLVLLATQDGRSAVLEYSDSSEQPPELIMRAKDNRYSFGYVGEPGRNAHTDVIVDGAAFGARIGPRDNATGDHNISIGLGWYGRAPEIVTRDGFAIRIGEIVANRTLPLEIAIPPQRTLAHREERIQINVTYDRGWTLTIGNATFVEDEQTQDTFAQTAYGVAIFLDKKGEDLAPNQGKEAELLVPIEQIFGTVRLEG
jgi:hypothetical protein